MLIVTEAKDKTKDDATRDQAGPGRYRIWGAILLTIAYVSICNWVGYWVPTVIFLFVSALVLGERNWLVLSVLPVVTTVVIYVVFYRFLHIPLPAGPLF
jgi:hypothetical protein